ncbi:MULTISPECIES: FimV/HubP family polar landmark protein, partial [Luteimonas]|uniref:FimV/HubP family polar landmark protein n=1 Tax=Luteimonas TaxID=83614 RepID=UPI0025463F37
APQPDVPVATQDATPAPASPAAATPAPVRAPADARLEITPPSGDGQQAGTQSGIDAGGGGDMLRQELQQANETVAARTAEIDELKARLADLEQLQAQQAQLIEMKDAELAAAQQRMAESNAQTPAAGGGFPWIWLGLALLVVGALAFLLGRRGGAVATPRVGKPAGFAAGTSTGSTSRSGAAPAADPAPAFVKAAPTAVAAAAPVVASGASPAWHAGDAPAREPVIPSVAPPLDETAPIDDAMPLDDATPLESDVPPYDELPSDAPSAPAAGDATPGQSAPVGVERIELARAYIELGDTATARSLLQEVIDGPDAAAGADAAALLRTLG